MCPVICFCLAMQEAENREQEGEGAKNRWEQGGEKEARLTSPAYRASSASAT